MQGITVPLHGFKIIYNSATADRFLLTAFWKRIGRKKIQLNMVHLLRNIGPWTINCNLRKKSYLFFIKLSMILSSNAPFRFKTLSILSLGKVIDNTYC